MPQLVKNHRRRSVASFAAVMFSLFGVNLLAAELGQTIHYFPQYAIGGGSTTFFNIYNPDDRDIVVNLTFYHSDGAILLSDSKTVAPEATLTAQYGGAAGVPEDGWVALTALEPFGASLYFDIQAVGKVGVASADIVEPLPILQLLRWPVQYRLRHCQSESLRRRFAIPFLCSRGPVPRDRQRDFAGDGALGRFRGRAALQFRSTGTC